MTEPEGVENIILRTDDGNRRDYSIKCRDLGRKDYSSIHSSRAKTPHYLLCINNPAQMHLRVAKQVYATLSTLSQSFPDGLEYSHFALDTTKFVDVSIEAVVHTFFEAVILVVLIVFRCKCYSDYYSYTSSTRIDLRRLNGMMAFGFSINMVTLFGMILAIAFVVDDAIVVIENTERNMTQFGLNAKDAAKKSHG